MKWAAPVRDEIAEHLVRLGLATCPICGGEALGVYDKPVVLIEGGPAWPTRALGDEKDRDAQVRFMVRIECNMCGYNLLFNVERFHDSETPVFEP